MSDWWSNKMGGGAPPQQAPQAYQQAPQQYEYRPPTSPQAPPPQPGPGAVTMENFGEMMAMWRGGPGARNTAHCPACGADTLFRRRVGQQEAAPLCYSCGFNGMYQQGDPANWQA